MNYESILILKFLKLERVKPNNSKINENILNFCPKIF